MLRIAGIALIGVLFGGAASVQGGGIRLLGAINGVVRNPSGCLSRARWFCWRRGTNA